jgi:hypothetical protein
VCLAGAWIGAWINHYRISAIKSAVRALVECAARIFAIKPATRRSSGGSSSADGGADRRRMPEGPHGMPFGHSSRRNGN